MNAIVNTIDLDKKLAVIELLVKNGAIVSRDSVDLAKKTSIKIDPAIIKFLEENMKQK